MSDLATMCGFPILSTDPLVIDTGDGEQGRINALAILRMFGNIAATFNANNGRGGRPPRYTRPRRLGKYKAKRVSQ